MRDVRQGMRVVDASGEDVGTVEDLQAGDTQAQTAQGQSPEGSGGVGLVGALADAFGGDETGVPPQRAERMLRVGYIKIDAKGLFAGDVYAAADQIDHVAQDVVHLTVDRDQLAG